MKIQEINEKELLAELAAMISVEEIEEIVLQ